MRITTFLILVISLHVSAKTTAQKITLYSNNITIEQFFDQLEKLTGYSFLLENGVVSKGVKVFVNVENEQLEVVLERVLKPINVTYKVENKTVYILKVSQPISLVDGSLLSDSIPLIISVHGQVFDSLGAPLAGASVTVKGIHHSVATNEKGEFLLKNIPFNATLIISHVGSEQQEIEINGKTELTVHLNKKIINLGNIQVVASNGYQTFKPNESVGSLVVIDNKTLNQQTGTNILKRLDNVTSGLLFNIGKQNNNPQNTTNISIRGLSTINGPLDPLVILDNFIYEGDINNINPNNVESVTVLKDAAATSIWGARAGNGVIVITSKKGRFNQKLKIDFNANVIITQKPDIFYNGGISSADEIDAEQNIFNRGYFDSQIDDIYQQPPLTPAVLIFSNRRIGLISAADSAAQINALKKIDTRQQYNKYFYQDAVTQQYSLNLRGGANNIAWLISGSYEQGSTNLKGENNKINVSFANTYKPAKNLQIDLNVYYTSSNMWSGLSTGFTIYGRQVPYLQLADQNGNALAVPRYNQNYIDTAGAGYLLDWKYRPLEDYKNDQTNIMLQEMVANIGLNYQIIPSLGFELFYQYQKQTVNSERIANLQSFYARDLINNFSQIDYANAVVNYPVPMGGILDEVNNNTGSQNFRAQLNFNKTWGDHAITAMAGNEIRELINDGYTTRFYGYNADPLSFGYVDNVNYYPTLIPLGYMQIPDPAGIYAELNNRFVSFYGNGSYVFRQRYSLYGSFRKDGSNIFGLSTNDKWKPLWSAGAGWDISKEKFYKIKVLPYIRMRITYGYSGNIDLTKTPLPISSSGYTDYTTNYPVMVINNPNNPLLRWEKIGQFDLGFDFASFNQVISGTIDYYQKKGTDLYGTTAFDYTAFPRTTDVTSNVANMQGSGFEITIRTKNIDRIFKWTSVFLMNHGTDKSDFLLLSPGTPSNHII